MCNPDARPVYDPPAFCGDCGDPFLCAKKVAHSGAGYTGLDLIHSEAGELAPALHAGSGGGKKTAANISGFTHETSAAYIRARLKRDGLQGSLRNGMLGHARSHQRRAAAPLA